MSPRRGAGRGIGTDGHGRKLASGGLGRVGAPRRGAPGAAAPPGFFDGLGAVLPWLGKYYVILVPAAGGLLVGPLVYFFAREAKGHGVPEVMLAVMHQGGRSRPR